jgi:hypothetical protein
MTEQTLAFHRLMDTFDMAARKRGHLHHTGIVHPEVGEHRVRKIKRACDSGVAMGLWCDL